MKVSSMIRSCEQTAAVLLVIAVCCLCIILVAINSLHNFLLNIKLYIIVRSLLFNYVIHL